MRCLIPAKLISSPSALGFDWASSYARSHRKTAARLFGLMHALDFRKLFKFRTPPIKGYCILTVASLFLGNGGWLPRYNSQSSPKGTNQVALTIGPAIQDGVYGVLASTNGPGGYWIVLGPFFGDTNKTLSVTTSHCTGPSRRLRDCSLAFLNLRPAFGSDISSR